MAMGGMCVQSIMAIRTIMLEIVINCLRLFVVVIVVMDGMCLQSITAIRTITMLEMVPKAIHLLLPWR